MCNIVTFRNSFTTNQLSEILYELHEATFNLTTPCRNNNQNPQLGPRPRSYSPSQLFLLFPGTCPTDRGTYAFKMRQHIELHRLLLAR